MGVGVGVMNYRGDYKGEGEADMFPHLSLHVSSVMLVGRWVDMFCTASVINVS